MTITKAVQGPITSFNIANDILSLVLQNSLVAQRVKHLPSMQETWVRSLGLEDYPGASQLLAFSPGKEQAAGVWETCLAPGWPHPFIC